jgi:von Willebrand factor type A domain
LAAVVLTMAAAAAGCGGESLGGNPLAGTGGSLTATGTSFGTGTGGDIGTGGGPPTCGEVLSFDTTPPIHPNILILMDRSSSLLDDNSGMACATGCGASSKWALLTAAVEKLVVGDTSVNWGLMFFGTDDACGTSPTPAVPISTSAATAMLISGALQSTTPGGEAPTAAAFSAATEYLASVADRSPKYILLVTDGRSGCSSDPATADIAAESAVQGTLSYYGFPTFVLASVAPSDPGAITALNQMASNGGEPLVGGANAFYTPADDLSAQLATLVGFAFNRCTFPIVAPLDISLFLAISATLTNGSQIGIPRDSTNGWEFVDSSETSVALNGTTCDDLKAGRYTEVSVAYQCNVPTLGHSRPVARSPISSSPSATR